jgi:predicted ester cyclase
MSVEDAMLGVKANLYDRIMASRRAEEIANKAIITRYVDATNEGELDILDGLVVPDYVEHDPVPGQKPGLEGLKEAYRMFNTPFPDLKFVFDDVIGEGDLVVGRGVISGTHQGEFFGIPATGKKVHWTGTRLFRLKDNRVLEGWVNIDMMGLMQQMGVIPAPPQSAPSDVPPPKKLTGAPSSREANKALMRRFIEEVWNKGNLEVADEIFHPEATSPSAPTLPPGPEGVKVIATMFRDAFPDYWMTIDYLVAEDDRVAARFTQGGTHKGELFGIPATGKQVKFTEMGILRIADGKVVESWYDVDMLGMMQQLGVGGSPEQGQG